jgi:membrane-bound lytic murein transglycosylase B
MSSIMIHAGTPLRFLKHTNTLATKQANDTANKHANYSAKPAKCRRAASWRILIATVLLFSTALPSLSQELLTGRPDVEAFLDQLAKQYNLDRKSLADQFKGMTVDPEVIRLNQPQPPGTKSWLAYRSSHLESIKIKEGKKFLAQHRNTLMAAQRAYGVPAEMITAILGIETNYGAYQGDFEALRTLTTMVFALPTDDSHPEWTVDDRDQLVNLFLLARDQGKKPNQYKGSFAGALGYPQFRPTSWRKFGVDGDGDGKVDLMNSVADAIFSIANYFKINGWQAGQPVAIPVRIEQQIAQQLRSMKGADKPNLTLQQLVTAGVQPTAGSFINDLAILVDLPTPGQATEYWVGYPNFNTIMQYNRSFFYAMAVYQLSQAISAS